MTMGAFWAKSFSWLFRAKSDHIGVILLCPIKTTLFSLKFVQNMFILCINDKGSFLGEKLSMTFSSQKWPYRRHPSMPNQNYSVFAQICPKHFYIVYRWQWELFGRKGFRDFFDPKVTISGSPFYAQSKLLYFSSNLSKTCLYLV